MKLVKITIWNSFVADVVGEEHEQAAVFVPESEADNFVSMMRNYLPQSFSVMASGVVECDAAPTDDYPVPVIPRS